MQGATRKTIRCVILPVLCRKVMPACYVEYPGKGGPDEIIYRAISQISRALPGFNQSGMPAKGFRTFTANSQPTG